MVSLKETHQLKKIIRVLTRSTRLLNKCQTRPVGGESASRLTKAFSVRVTLFPFAICRIIFSASSNRPCVISHLGDSGINLLHKRNRQLISYNHQICN